MIEMFSGRKNTLEIWLGQVVGFGLAGFISLGLTLSITALLHEKLLMPVRISYAFGLATAILVNFYFCRNVIFRSNKNLRVQLIIFVLSSFFFRGLEYGSFLIQETFIHLPYLIAILLIHVISFAIKFCYYKMFVFASGK